MASTDQPLTKMPSEDEDLDQLLDSALDDFDQPTKGRAKRASGATEHADTSAEAELLRLFEKAGLSVSHDSAADLREELEKLAGLAAGESATPGLDPEISLKEMMQQMTADTEQLGQALSEAELNTMFQQLQAGGEGPEELDKLIPMMEGMMQSLLSKDLLYPAIKEMSDRFPDWLADHRATLSADDFTRYNRQFELTRLICRHFEEEDEGVGTSGHADKTARFQRVMSLMQEMQELGQPPKELVGTSADLGPLGAGAQDQCVLS